MSVIQKGEQFWWEADLTRCGERESVSGSSDWQVFYYQQHDTRRELVRIGQLFGAALDIIKCESWNPVETYVEKTFVDNTYNISLVRGLFHRQQAMLHYYTLSSYDYNDVYQVVVWEWHGLICTTVEFLSINSWTYAPLINCKPFIRSQATHNLMICFLDEGQKYWFQLSVWPQQTFNNLGAPSYSKHTY